MSHWNGQYRKAYCKQSVADIIGEYSCQLDQAFGRLCNGVAVDQMLGSEDCENQHNFSGPRVNEEGRKIFMIEYERCQNWELSNNMISLD